MQIWHWWIVAGVALFILEIFTPGFVAAAFGLACLAGAAASWAGGGAAWQISVFAAASLFAFMFMRPFFKKALMKSGDPAGLGAAALVGREGLVIEKLDPAQGRGRVKLGGETWRAAPLDHKPMEQGSKVRVERLEGVTLLVSQMAEED